MEPVIQKNYDYKIDIIRAVACLLVAIVHISVPTWTNQISSTGFGVSDVFKSIIMCGWIGVPIFLFISGYSLAINKVSILNAEIDIIQFYKNRILRISPMWVICITVLIISHKISGNTAINLFIFQLQDLPASTAFNIGWSLQLEFACYLLFPIFFIAIQKNNIKRIFCMVTFFIIMRLYVYYMPASAAINWGYGSIFGGAVIFIAGMHTAKNPKLINNLKSKILLTVGIFSIIIYLYLVYIFGNWQNPEGRIGKYLIFFMPEIMSFCMICVIKGYMTQPPDINTNINFITKSLSYFGTISYSAYLLSLFTNDLTSRVLSFIEPSGWISLISYFILYLSFLVLISSLSYFGIEKPFLDLRKKDIIIK